VKTILIFLILTGGIAMSYRILLVDDAQVIRVMLTKILKAAGYEIAGEASNGLEAVEKYKDLNPDLVTMDITMPTMSGIEAVREIRKYDPEAKIIMCSAIGQKSMVIEAIEAGARNYIIKPFEPQKVINVISAVLP
jgi:two-component system chemotaxis response regulator CheY